MKRTLLCLLAAALLLTALAGCGAPGGEALKRTFPADAAVSYLGPAGTYTESAARRFFGDGALYQPRATVPDAIADLASGAADYAVIPQENTLGGAVVAYVDTLIAARSVSVAGEIILPISQTLMALPGATVEGIRTVYSHTQGLVQSAAWRAQHMPLAAAEETASTAAAAQKVAESGDLTLAAVAAPGAAALYGLEVLAEDVQITDTNKTRFYVLTTEAPARSGGEHAVFLAGCEAGRLDDIIVALHRAGFELAALHDRPAGTALGDYNYVIEVCVPGGIAEKQLRAVEQEEALRFLGCFDVLE